jgi:hypothetical protein
MTFIGDVALVQGRSPSETTTVVLRKCLGCDKQAAEREIDGFLESLSIKPAAFFKDIDADWIQRPFIGQHVFKVVQAAGYGGTEDDLWFAVVGARAPYAIKGRGGQQKKKAAVTKLKTAIKARPNKPRSRRSPS